MVAPKNVTVVDARNSVINRIQGSQINYHGDALDQILRKLEPARMDASDRSTCLKGTRMELLRSITDWASRPSPDQRILWLHGLVGSGKSTISTTVANFFDDKKCLGAFVFFDRDVEERNQPSNVIRSISHQLGKADSGIGIVIAQTLNAISNITSLTPIRQFTDLVLNPLLSLPKTEMPLVIVIDALDECGNANSREQLLEALVNKSAELPPVVRIIITSRKEPDILAAFTGKSHILVQELDLTTHHNMEDILIFLRNRMSNINSRNPGLRLAPDWPGYDKILALGERAAGLFVWASTACLYIGGHDPPKRLNLLLQGDVDANSQSALDVLYATALKSADNGNDEDFRSDFLSIMGAIIVARNPLSDEAIDTLLCLKRPSLHTILKLGCVLRWSKAEPIRVIHPSFTDYLSTRLRREYDALYIDTQLHHRQLAMHCLRYLDGILRRNLCDLKLSTEPIPTKIAESISYASASWITHVIHMTQAPECFGDELERFLSEHLLHWLEAMGILKKSRDASVLLRSLLDWVGIHLKHCPKLCDLVSDGHRFAHLFSPLIEQHPLLIYESALPFSPGRTTLYTTFRSVSGIPRIVGRLEDLWSPRLMVLSEHDQSVLAVTMTPNDIYIIAGLGDGTIGIWDAASGAEARPRLRGHSGSVHSVACSPDGIHIASGSEDSTVRLWDIQSGTEVTVLQGHKARVTSVCFSPVRTNSRMSLLSGSQDHTIRLWDLLSGMHVIGRCRDVINAVAFSPEGTRFVSGAANGIVRVRDTDSGNMVFVLLSSQTSVRSVAYSPNGQWIISGSTDKIIRIWNATSGEQAFKPLMSHEYSRPIRSLAFLPDEKRIISGAENGTIRVWDFELGIEDRPPLREHIRSVEAIIVSHDGRHIISGSKDRTIRIWDTEYSTKAIETEFPPHGTAITALALSCDGTQFATASKDKCIRLWDTTKGEEVLRALKGHKGIVRSLSFAPDGSRIASGEDAKDGVIRIWDAKSGHLVLPLLRGRNIGATISMAFSSDGRRLVTGSVDGIIRVWDVYSTAQPLSLQGHKDQVRCVAFSPDGSQIISGSNDCTIRVWNANSGSQLCTPFTEHKYFIRSVAFSPDGLQILSKSCFESSSHKVVHKWSPQDASGSLISKSYCISHRTSHVLDPFSLTYDGWIVDMSAEKRLSKLPPNISILSVTASASSDTSFIFTTDRGTVIVVHFPECTSRDVPPEAGDNHGLN